MADARIRLAEQGEVRRPAASPSHTEDGAGTPQGAQGEAGCSCTRCLIDEICDADIAEGKLLQMSELAASDSRYCLSHKFNTAVEFLLIETYLAIGKLWNELLNEIKSRGPRKKTMKEDLWKMIRDAFELEQLATFNEQRQAPPRTFLNKWLDAGGFFENEENHLNPLDYVCRHRPEFRSKWLSDLVEKDNWLGNLAKKVLQVEETVSKDGRKLFYMDAKRSKAWALGLSNLVLALLFSVPTALIAFRVLPDEARVGIFIFSVLCAGCITHVLFDGSASAVMLTVGYGAVLATLAVEPR